MAASVRRRAPLRKRLLSSVLATVMSLGLAEGLVRLWGALTGEPGPMQFLAIDERLGWRNRPGYDGRHVTADFDVAVHFDELGARRPMAGAAPQQAKVLAIGDSTTFGWGVEAAATFAAALGDRLHVDVCNLGVSGYGTDQQLLLLREACEHMAPRLVVVMHTENDVTEVLQDRPYGRFKPCFVVDGDELRLTGVPTPTSWLTEHSQLWRTGQKRLGAFDLEVLSPAATASGRDLVHRLYRAMQKECAARGMHFLLAGQSADWLRDLARRDGMPYLDLTATFVALQGSGPVHFAGDPHWLPRVHAAVAVELAARIERDGLLRD